MKKHGAILDFTLQRNRELMRVYRDRINEASYIYMPDIFRLVANSPCMRFWVSEERAIMVFNAMITGRKLPRMNPNKKEMFEEIFKRVLLLFEVKPHLTISELVTEVVHQPAPKFYMTARSAGEYIYRIKQRIGNGRLR